jgi:hypothetical protein
MKFIGATEYYQKADLHLSLHLKMTWLQNMDSAAVKTWT